MTEWYFEQVPATRTRAVRTLVFGYAAVWLAVRSVYVLDTAELPDRRFEGVGVWAGLDGPMPTTIIAGLLAVALLSSGLAALGRAERAAPPLAALATLAVVTYTNSWGQVFHTENLLVLHLAVLGVAAAAGIRPEQGWPLRLMSVLTVLAYAIAGWAKLDIGGTDWLTGDVLRNQVAFDNLRKILLGDVHSPIGGWLVGIGWIWVPIAVVAVVAELGAPLALLGGRIRTMWVATVWTFHLGILVMMAILFPYPLSGVAFVSMFRAERLAPMVRSIFARGRAREPATVS